MGGKIGQKFSHSGAWQAAIIIPKLLLNMINAGSRLCA